MYLYDAWQCSWVRLAYSDRSGKRARFASLLWLRFYSNKIPLCTFKGNCKDQAGKQVSTKQALMSVFIRRKQTPGGCLIPASQPKCHIHIPSGDSDLLVFQTTNWWNHGTRLPRPNFNQFLNVLPCPCLKKRDSASGNSRANRFLSENSLFPLACESHRVAGYKIPVILTNLRRPIMFHLLQAAQILRLLTPCMRMDWLNTCPTAKMRPSEVYPAAMDKKMQTASWRCITIVNVPCDENAWRCW